MSNEWTEHHHVVDNCTINLLEPGPTMAPGVVAMLQIVYDTNTLNVGMTAETLRQVAEAFLRRANASPPAGQG